MPVTQQVAPMQRTVCITGEGRVKLRSSCDACSAAKVKCDRQNPCGRCQNNLINCSYSPSRRHGKQPWAKRVTEQHQRYLQPTMHSHTSAAPATTNSFIQFPPQPVAPGSSAMPSTISQVTPTSPTGNFALGNSPMRSPSTDQSSSVSNGFLFRNPWSGVGPSVAPALTASPASTSTPTISEASMSPLLELAFQAPAHDCEAKALATLHSLHHNTTLNFDVTAVERPTPGDPRQRMPSLDKILYVNRVAISTIRQLLECPCAQQPHIALLYLAIVSKTLLWYQLAVNLSFRTAARQSQEFSSPQPQPQPYSLSSGPNISTAASNVVLNQTTGAPKPNTVQIGVFELEEEDEAILVRSVVATEVKKAGRLVELMKAGGTVMNQEERQEQEYLDTDSWYRAGGGKLERDVQDTLRKVMESAKYLPINDRPGKWNERE